MTRWTICFDAIITAGVEAKTAKQAVEAAHKTLDAIGIDGVKMSGGAHCCISRIQVVRDDQTGVDDPN